MSTTKIKLEDIIAGKKRMGLDGPGPVQTFPRAKREKADRATPEPGVMAELPREWILGGVIHKGALVRYMIPLALGTFFGGVISGAFGIPGVLVMSVMFIGVIGAVMSS